jgi:hypothetical protein
MPKWTVYSNLRLFLGSTFSVDCKIMMNGVDGGMCDKGMRNLKNKSASSVTSPKPITPIP